MGSIAYAFRKFCKFNKIICSGDPKKDNTRIRELSKVCNQHATDNVQDMIIFSRNPKKNNLICNKRCFGKTCSKNSPQGLYDFVLTESHKS